MLRSLWSFAAGAWGAQPQRQPVSTGEGALPQPPTAPAREILLGVTGLSPTSPSPRARERGPQRLPPALEGSEEQHGGASTPHDSHRRGDHQHRPSRHVPRAGCPQVLGPACTPPRGSPPPCLSQPAVAKQCPQLQQLRRAPGRPRGHGPLAGLLSSHLPPPAPDQACRCPPAANRAASGRGN